MGRQLGLESVVIPCFTFVQGKFLEYSFSCIYVSCEVRAEVAFSTSIFSLCGCIAFPASLALSVLAAHDPLRDCGCVSDKQGSPL